MKQPTITTKKVSELQEWDKNQTIRGITEARYKQLKSDIERDGFQDVLKVAADGKTVIGGNHRLKILKELEISEIPVIVTDAKTDKEIFSRALRDNEEFAYYEEQGLAELAISLELNPLELESFELHLSKPTNLKVVIDDLSPEEVKEDEAPPIADTVVSKLGEVYQLGKHRVMCGDSTKDVPTLMDGAKADFVLVDPPYGMFLDTDFSTIKGTMGSIGATHGTKGKKYDKVIGDHDDFDPELITTIFDNFEFCDEMFIFGGDYFAELIPDKNKGSWCVWDKRKESQENAIGAEFELIWSKKKHKRRMLRHDWFGFLSSENTQDARNRVHPTQKPITLLSDILNQWGKDAKIVVDIYLGSGSTLIACEQTDRTCYGMELDPKYVDVIRKRYAKHVEPELWEEQWESLTPAVQQ